MRLVLMRHAKAEQGSPDIDRALSDRGRSDAAAIGRWLAGQGIVPDRVVISPSRRTRQTWELAGTPGAPAPEVDDRIYANSVADLLDVIRETPDDVQTLVLVGHNPSMGELAATIDRDVRDFPTSATAIVEVASWADVRQSGRLVARTVPRG
jgi:phosphohistidine phosphatase